MIRDDGPVFHAAIPLLGWDYWGEGRGGVGRGRGGSPVRPGIYVIDDTASA